MNSIIDSRRPASKGLAHRTAAGPRRPRVTVLDATDASRTHGTEWENMERPGVSQSFRFAHVDDPPDGRPDVRGAARGC